MQEPSALDREHGIIKKHFSHMLILWVALFATLNIILFLGVWYVKDTKVNLFMVPAVWVLALYFFFTAYSVYVMLATELGPQTKRSGKLLWWHGAGWVIAMALCAVLGLAASFIRLLV